MTPRVGSGRRIGSRVIAVTAMLLAAVLPATTAHAASSAGRLSLHSTALSYKVGTTVSLTGSVTPRGSASVTVERLAGKKWVVLGHAKPSAAGTFAFSVRAPKATTVWSVRAVRAKSGKAKALTSAVIKVRVVKTAFAVRASGASVIQGAPVVITGKVAPKATGSVALQVLKGKTWTTLAKAKLTKSASFSLSSVQPVGSYGLRVLRTATTTVAQGVSKTVTVSVARPPLVISTTVLPDGSAGIPYTATLSAAGGLPPYSWSASGLPAGVTISASGVLAGTSAVVVHATPAVTVTDAAGSRTSATMDLRFGLAAAATQQLWAWGEGAYGQLGTGDTPSEATSPRAVGLTGVTAATGGSGTTYALRYDGSVWAFGRDTGGALGDGGARAATGSTRPIPVAGLGRTVALAAATGSGYALEDDGTVWDWGLNSAGELGDGSTTNRLSPQRVPVLSHVTAIAAALQTAFAVDADGSVWSWGSNGSGQLGDGTTTPRSTPQKVPGLTQVIAISAGPYTAEALKADGTVWMWGRNDSYQLGDGTTTDRPVPAQVAGLSGVVSVAANRVNSYAVTSSGAVWAWGFGAFGGVGQGTSADAPTPVTVLVPSARSVTAGPEAAIVRLADGTVASWGANGVGQLGNNSTTQSASPVSVDGLTHVVAVGSGEVNAYAVTAS